MRLGAQVHLETNVWRFEPVTYDEIVVFDYLRPKCTEQLS